MWSSILPFMLGKVNFTISWILSQKLWKFIFDSQLCSYLCVKIQDGEAHSILCPSFECQQLVPIDIIEKIVSPEMVRRYLEFDIEAFVESNPNIKWCPFPGCSRAVKLPDSDANPEEVIIIPNCLPPAPVSHAVDCGNGHYFCWFFSFLQSFGSSKVLSGVNFVKSSQGMFRRSSCSCGLRRVETMDC